MINIDHATINPLKPNNENNYVSRMIVYLHKSDYIPARDQHDW